MIACKSYMIILFRFGIFKHIDGSMVGRVSEMILNVRRFGTETKHKFGGVDAPQYLVNHVSDAWDCFPIVFDLISDFRSCSRWQY